MIQATAMRAVQYYCKPYGNNRRRLVGWSVGRSLDGSIAGSVSQSFGSRSFVLSVGGSFGRLVQSFGCRLFGGRSFVGLLVRSVDRSVFWSVADRYFDRYFGRSIGRSFDRSEVGRSVN